MEYPPLSLDQLIALEKELIEFLVIHGIDGDTWKELNAEAPQKAEELVKLFGKTVWDKIADETTTLKRVLENEQILVKIDGTEGLMLHVWHQDGKIQVHRGVKKMSQNHRQEVLELFNQGFERASHVEFTEALKNYLPSNAV
ncbi:MAG: hypothetical protein EBR54_09625 [Flavobacteriia bacterium]|jgi:hypothetical protein|nr:hypothetical protein [Flavobacteriia bacterium]